MTERETRNAIAREFAADRGPELVGRPLIEAEAEAAAAGLRTKTIPQHGVTTMEFGIGRVRITVDDDEIVTAVQPG